MPRGRMRFVGVELYFDDLEGATRFYRDLLGLELTEEEPGTYSKFDSENGFLCLEKKGLETYPSKNKAVVFLEVAEVQQAIEAIGKSRILQAELDGAKRPPWAVLHDPEGHNVILLQAKEGGAGR
jgi:predicted enzyme related to lactoylglutathione lyase